MGEVSFPYIGNNGFHVEAENERFPSAGWCCRQNLKYENQFHVAVWQTTSKNCTKKRAARAARLFFLLQPIMFLICDVAVPVAVPVAVDVVVSWQQQQ